MTLILSYTAVLLFFWLLGFAIYMLCNHGLAPNARLQQFFRYFMGAAITVVPLVVTQTNPLQPTLILLATVSLGWMITYPLAFHLTHRKSMPDYDNQIDIAFGIYLFGWLASLSLIPYSGLIIGIAVFVLLFLPIAQWVYYAMYHSVISESGMQLIQDTDYNEALEFIGSYPKSHVAVVAQLICLVAGVCVGVPMYFPLVVGNISIWRILILIAITLFTTTYIWKRKHGLYIRTGIYVLYANVRLYVSQNSHYAKLHTEHFAKLNAEILHPIEKPHTIIMVIGESASRDYMSAFMEGMKEETTPWMKELSKDTKHCTLFPHAYSSGIQTVPTLEKALTEFNQYDGGDFYSASSIVDIAKKLGYNVSWFSNQGHIGSADTPITLVANMADTAKWTQQELTHIHYDETLLDMVKEVDSNRNNLIVLHLMGSHFNYENRFPPRERAWNDNGTHNKILNYKNTLHYTDSVLKRLFDYTHNKLNLQAMVYFSDHADVPDRHRQPNFGGFRDIRIPLMVWLGDEFLAARPQRAEALKANSESYWTNDLVYELMCGLMDAKCDHFNEQNSLASTTYNKKREQLTALDGRIHISEDNIPYGPY